jgi:hypothetical protein
MLPELMSVWSKLLYITEIGFLIDKETQYVSRMGMWRMMI